MPAAAVIPAPIAYIKVVAVKKLVVGFLVGVLGHLRKGLCMGNLRSSSGELAVVFKTFTLRKLECSRQAIALNILAWNNDIGPWFYFVGF